MAQGTSPLNMLEQFKQQLQAEGSVVFTVRARPDASITKIKDKLEDESLKMDIHAPADQGKANTELIRFLAKEFAVPSANVSILSGATMRHKLIKITLITSR